MYTYVYTYICRYKLHAYWWKFGCVLFAAAPFCSRPLSLALRRFCAVRPPPRPEDMFLVPPLSATLPSTLCTQTPTRGRRALAKGLSAQVGGPNSRRRACKRGGQTTIKMARALHRVQTRPLRQQQNKTTTDGSRRASSAANNKASRIACIGSIGMPTTKQTPLPRKP